MNITFKAFVTALPALALAASVTGGAGAAPPPASAPTVHIKDFKYNPATITIHAGDRVTFINDDDEAHTVTAADKSFDSQGMDTGNRWQHVFGKPGTYAYFCEMHPYMKATVVVLAATRQKRSGR